MYGADSGDQNADLSVVLSPLGFAKCRGRLIISKTCEWLLPAVAGSENVVDTRLF